MVAVVVLSTPATSLVQATAVLAGAALAVLVARHPGAGLLALAILVPLQILVMAALYRLGLPAGVVRPLGLWKEAVLAGLLVAAGHRVLARRSRLDGLDVAALVYVAAVTTYLVVPALFLSAGSAGGEGPQTLLARTVAYRFDVGFVVLFLAARHAPVAPRWLNRFIMAIFVIGVAFSALVVVEQLAGARWYSVVADALEVPGYRADVLGVEGPKTLSGSPAEGLGVAGVSDPGPRTFSQSSGLRLLLPLAVGIGRIVHHRARRWEQAGTIALALALVLSQTRSALLAAVVVGAVAIRFSPARARPARPRLVVALAALSIAIVPVAAATGLARQIVAVADVQDESTRGHLEGLRSGLAVVRQQPLGQGLGTSPGVSERFDREDRVVSENYYLQVANEIGVPTLLAFLTMLALLIRKLLRAAGQRGDSMITGATAGAMVGLTVASLILHVWNDLGLAWPMWAAAGLVLSVSGPQTGSFGSRVGQPATGVRVSPGSPS